MGFGLINLQPLFSPFTSQECARTPAERVMVRSAGMIPDLVDHLKRPSVELQIRCSSALFCCSQDPDTAVLVRKQQGLPTLVNLLSAPDNHDLLFGVTGALWYCAGTPENTKILSDLKAVEILVGKLQNQEEDVLINVAGALAALAVDASCRKAIRYIVLLMLPLRDTCTVHLLLCYCSSLAVTCCCFPLRALCLYFTYLPYHVIPLVFL